MIRALTLGAVIALSAMVGGWSPPSNPDACKLAALKDAEAIIGPPLATTHTESNATFSNCLYRRPGANPMAMTNNVEVHYCLLTDAAAAQAKFQRVLHPGPLEQGTTISAVPELGDEADIKRTASYNLSSIEFRRGAAVVTLGVSPIVSDSLLKAAAVRALSHL